MPPVRTGDMVHILREVAQNRDLSESEVMSASDLGYGPPRICGAHGAATATVCSADHPVEHRAARPNRSQRVRDASDPMLVTDGPLGSVTVVADAYAGPMPPDAIRKSVYDRMVHIIERIDSGDSSVQFDLSNFFGAAGETDGAAYTKATSDAAKFREQYMGYIRELVRTPAGLQLLTRLDRSKYKTTLKHNTGLNAARPKEDSPAGHLSRRGRPGPSTDVTVLAAPNLTEWDTEMCLQGKQPWMENRPKFAFYHELVHAYHFNRGDNALDGHSHAQCVTYEAAIPKKEFQAVGLGPYAADPVSENAIRVQMGVPLRPTYSGASWDGPDIWRKHEDANEPLHRSPSR